MLCVRQMFAHSPSHGYSGMLSSLYLRTLTLTTLASCLLITGCSRDSATQCIFNDDCAQPYEYCSSQTGLCTAYECLEDSDCKSTERCSLITNTCILKPRPDMSVMPEMGREDMDDRPDLQGPVDMPDTPDLGPPDLGPPDLGPPPDMGPPRDTIKPEIVRITPAPGSSVDFTDDLPDTITVDFSEPLDAISLSPFSVELTDETGAEIDL